LQALLVLGAFDDLLFLGFSLVFLKVKACCSPLGKAAARVVEAEDIDEVVVAAELEQSFGENLVASDGERRPASPDAEDTLLAGGSDGESSRTYYFWLSAITVGKCYRTTSEIHSKFKLILNSNKFVISKGPKNLN
jgi:hypothetical protein